MAVDGGDGKTVALQGPATIYEVAAIRETLRDGLDRAGELRIDLGDSGKWDLAGLQLLVSCVNAGRKLGRTVRLVRVPPICRDIAARSGLAEWLDSHSK
jgi:ABC-type transporter Mla MlaB component